MLAAAFALPVVIAVGMHPLECIAGATWLPFGDDELGLAGALHGEPAPMTPGMTVPFDVPAHAEFVIESYVPPACVSTKDHSANSCSTTCPWRRIIAST